ncbi:AAA family ATPase [Tautonia plasticadhaerens]|uniref:Septum site-determining protein MinD n=1 Tax=Tautonia plasticadhaerens TaxID=2527974 RepID=A0A518H552_9BACT|nr:response regulator [Tautonia plasticadhaerens]QDV35953.1 Septum site-determining protein MinD [Tautonia plasticadhaerens]
MDTARRLLLVDPDSASRAAVQAALSGLGMVRVERSIADYDGAVRALDGPAIDLLLIVLDADPERALAAIRQIRAAAPRVPILPASRSRDGETILKALRAGATEFLPLPIDAEEARASIDRLMPSAAPEVAGQGAMLTIVGASGGVGCTTLAVNLATMLAKAPGASVALVDLDLLLGCVDTLLDVMPELTLADVTSEIDRYDETLLHRVLTRHESGVHVLSAPTDMEDAARVEPEALRRLLELLLRAFRFVVVDVSKGFQATDFIALELADTILMVTQLDVCSLRNGARLMQLFRQVEGVSDRVKVVVNRVGSDITSIGLKKAEETLGAPIGWQIPNVSDIVNSARVKGVPIEVEAPKHRITRALQDIARGFAPIGGDRPPKPFLGKFAAMFT